MLMPWSIDVIGFCVMRLKNLAILSLLLIILIVVVGLPESLDTIMSKMLRKVGWLYCCFTSTVNI